MSVFRRVMCRFLLIMLTSVAMMLRRRMMLLVRSCLTSFMMRLVGAWLLCLLGASRSDRPLSRLRVDWLTLRRLTSLIIILMLWERFGLSRFRGVCLRWLRRLVTTARLRVSV